MDTSQSSLKLRQTLEMYALKRDTREVSNGEARRQGEEERAPPPTTQNTKFLRDLTKITATGCMRSCKGFSRNRTKMFHVKRDLGAGMFSFVRGGECEYGGRTGAR
jgi:hypothetical protein